jgi:cell division protein FtsI (penicillin-binding protein 3)
VKGATLHDSHKHGMLSVNDVLALSSNIGAAKICERFSRAEIYGKLRDFGFGVSTGVELAGEQTGYIPPISTWSGPTQANLAFGHGISCTPLQLAMAYASVANGGTLMKPRLVKSVDYPSGDHIEYPVQINKRTMSPEVAAELTDMLVGVVEHGTGELAQIKGIRIAGKTGTAQKVDQVHKTYFAKRFVSSFVGFFPAEKPKYVLLVVVDDPRVEYYGASVAAPTFRMVVEEILMIRTRDFENAPPAADVEFATRDKRPEVKPREALATVSYPTVFVDDPDNAATVTNTVPVAVPNLEGWPLRKAVQELSKRHLSFKLLGSRRVVTQLPAPGTIVPAGTVCELYGE